VVVVVVVIIAASPDHSHLKMAEEVLLNYHVRVKADMVKVIIVLVQ